MRKIRHLLLSIPIVLLLWAGQSPGDAAADDTLSAEVEILREAVADLSTRLDRQLVITGYYDFEYLTDNRSGSYGHFRQHHISLFFSRTWDRWRLFTELEFEDGVELSGSGGSASGNGTVKLEHGWLEYTRSENLVVRAGKLLLPQYWNVNHYPNVVLSTNRPLMVRKVFPSTTTGIMVHGFAFAGAVSSTYHAYVGNGMATDASKTDDNENKAVGGHLALHLAEVVGGLSRFDIAITHHSENSPSVGGALDVSGAELQLANHRFELLAEYAARLTGPDREGFYVQPSILLTDRVNGFYRYDYHDDGSDARTRHTVGFNHRPMPNVSLKLEVNTTSHNISGAEDCQGLAASVALFF